jgi:hypothetical protein
MCPPRFARLKVGSSFRVLNSDRSAASGLPIWRVAILKILAPTSSALATTGVAAAPLDGAGHPRPDGMRRSGVR